MDENETVVRWKRELAAALHQAEGCRRRGASHAEEVWRWEAETVARRILQRTRSAIGSRSLTA